MRKTITVRSLEVLAEKLKPYNNKLAKRGIAPVTIASSALKTKKIMIGENAFLEPVFVTIYWYEVELELAVENLGFANTTLLGFVEITSLGDLILHPMADGAEPILEAFRGTEIRCEHCGSARKRKKTFVFQKDDKVLMIGKDCAEEYFGLDFAQALNEFISFDPQGGGDPDSEEFFGGRGYKWFFDRQEFLAACLMVIKDRGFAGKNSNNPTVSIVSRVMYPPEERFQTPDDRKYIAQFKQEGPKLIEQLEGIFQYFHTLETKDSFLLNCKAALMAEDYNREGLLACAVNAYFKEKFSEIDRARRAAWEAKKAAKAEAGSSTTHYGAIGERIEVEVIYAETKQIECDSDFSYGDTISLIKFFTDNGSEVNWFTTASSYNLEQGQRYLLRGTVKKHGEFRGVKSTSIKRGNIKPLGADGKVTAPLARVEAIGNDARILCPHCWGGLAPAGVDAYMPHCWTPEEIEKLLAEDKGEPRKCTHCRKKFLLPTREAVAAVSATEV